MQIETRAPVLVTGGTGYVGGWIVQSLLAAGVTVHATTRDPAGPRAAALRQVAQGLPGRLELFGAELLHEGDFDVPMRGCEVVFHTASPFVTRVRDAQAELIGPAVQGTRNVLGSANRSDSVRRVVLTSSIAAMFGDQADLRSIPGGVLSETYWNTSSSLHHQPYAYSKTLAEGAAWEMANAQARWRLVVINPGLVMGPGVLGVAPSESFALIRQLGDGSLKHGVPPYQIGMVDVRDVAQAHLAAGFLPRAEGRHLVVERGYRFAQIAEALRSRFPDQPISTRELPKALLWMLGPMVSRQITRKMVSRCFGHPWRGDNRKSVQMLGLQYRPVPEAAAEMFAQVLAGRG